MNELEFLKDIEERLWEGKSVVKRISDRILQIEEAIKESGSYEFVCKDCYGEPKQDKNIED